MDTNSKERQTQGPEGVGTSSNEMQPSLSHTQSKPEGSHVEHGNRSQEKGTLVGRP